MLVKFQTIKQDIKQGMDLEYFFTYYKYEVTVNVMREAIFYSFRSKDGECCTFMLPKDDYMEMKYKEFLNIVHQHLYYNCYNCEEVVE